MPALNRIAGTRIVAAPAALDAALAAGLWPKTRIALRFAPDELFVTGAVSPAAILALDPHAIVSPEGGYAGVWLPMAIALDLLARTCEWAPPGARPAIAQGMVAGLPLKLWFEARRVLFLLPAPYAQEFEERMG